MQKKIYNIPEMCCHAEEVLIRNKLSSIKEISLLEFNLLQQELTVTFGLEDDNKIMTALTEINMHPKHDKTSYHKIENHNKLIYNFKNILLIISGITALAAEILLFTNIDEKYFITIGLSLFSMLASGKEIFIKGIMAVRNFSLNINFLMMIAITGAVLIGEWPEAAMVTFLFAVAEGIEGYSLDKARNAIHSLMEITPEVANVKDEFGVWQKKDVSTITIDQMILVKPGERIPLDGVVISGNSNVNQAPITGESMPVSKKNGDQVFAGSINEQGSFEFKVTTQANNTTLARIIRAIQQAQSERTTTEKFVDQFSRYYTPIMVLVAILIATIPPFVFGAALAPWIYKALVLLVIACPCALVISTPVTVVCGLAAAAKQGVLIKGGVYLEIGHKLKAIALDKTGTLTNGKPIFTDIISLVGIKENTLLKLAASLDIHSEHPVARAIVTRWTEFKSQTQLLTVNGFAAIPGKGVTGIIENERYYIGNYKLIKEKVICNSVVEASINRLEQEGKTTLVLSNDKEPIAVFAVADTLRNTSIKAIKELQDLGIIPIMLTGDNFITANAIASNVGINDIRANLLPENKLEEMNNLLEKYRYVGMVGDGINDAPALAKSSIGFAMGAAGTATAIETADVALMEDNLDKLSFFIKLSKKTSQILIQNISLAISVKILFFVLALLGKATLWMAVFADMGVSLIVVFNGLRLLGFTANKR